MSEERGVRSRKWYETIEQAEMQARTRLSDERFAEWQNLRAWQQEQQAQPMSDSHRAWQQQLQQAEMQAQAAAEAQALTRGVRLTPKIVARERVTIGGADYAIGGDDHERLVVTDAPPQSERFEPAGTLADVFGSPRRPQRLKTGLKTQMSDPPQSQTAAEAQRADEPAQQYNGRCITCGRITDVVYAGQCCVCDVFGSTRRSGLDARLDRHAAMSDPPQSEQPATDTSAGAVQRRIDDVCQDLVAGRTTPAQQRGLGGAVERAGRIPTGSDAAVGRIARLPR